MSTDAASMERASIVAFLRMRAGELDADRQRYRRSIDSGEEAVLRAEATALRVAANRIEDGAHKEEP